MFGKFPESLLEFITLKVNVNIIVNIVQRLNREINANEAHNPVSFVKALILLGSEPDRPKFTNSLDETNGCIF